MSSSNSDLMSRLEFGVWSALGIFGMLSVAGMMYLEVQEGCISFGGVPSCSSSVMVFVPCSQMDMLTGLASIFFTVIMISYLIRYCWLKRKKVRA